MSTDIESVIAAIREASAKTMQDKWVAWFQAEQSEVCRVHTQGATVACSVLEADAAHIAACSPANMAVVLAHIDNLTSERDEARAEVSYFKELAEKRNDRICELLEDSIARRAAISAPAPTETGIPASERNQQVAAEAPITDADINAHLARLYAAKGREMPESERVSRASAPQAAEPRGCRSPAPVLASPPSPPPSRLPSARRRSDAWRSRARLSTPLISKRRTATTLGCTSKPPSRRRAGAMSDVNETARALLTRRAGSNCMHGDDCECETCCEWMVNAIAIAVEAERERIEKIARGYGDGWIGDARKIADAIRALKETHNG